MGSRKIVRRQMLKRQPRSCLFLSQLTLLSTLSRVRTVKIFGSFNKFLSPARQAKARSRLRWLTGSPVCNWAPRSRFNRQKQILKCGCNCRRAFNSSWSSANVWGCRKQNSSPSARSVSMGKVRLRKSQRLRSLGETTGALGGIYYGGFFQDNPYYWLC